MHNHQNLLTSGRMDNIKVGSCFDTCRFYSFTLSAIFFATPCKNLFLVRVSYNKSVKAFHAPNPNIELFLNGIFSQFFFQNQPITGHSISTQHPLICFNFVLLQPKSGRCRVMTTASFTTTVSDFTTHITRNIHADSRD